MPRFFQGAPNSGDAHIKIKSNCCLTKIPESRLKWSIRVERRNWQIWMALKMMKKRSTPELKIGKESLLTQSLKKLPSDCRTPTLCKRGHQ